MTIRTSIVWQLRKEMKLDNKTKGEGGKVPLCLVHASNGFIALDYWSHATGKPVRLAIPNFRIVQPGYIYVTITPFEYFKKYNEYRFWQSRKFNNQTMCKFPYIASFIWNWYKREIADEGLKLTIS